MTEVDSLSKDADIDIGALFASLRRNWLLIISGAAIMAVLAWIICLLLTPDYRAETRILIESRESVLRAPMVKRRPNVLSWTPKALKVRSRF